MQRGLAIIIHHGDADVFGLVRSPISRRDAEPSRRVAHRPGMCVPFDDRFATLHVFLQITSPSRRILTTSLKIFGGQMPDVFIRGIRWVFLACGRGLQKLPGEAKFEGHQERLVEEEEHLA